MKFKQHFEETLASNEFPQAWIAQAVAYRQLKKHLKDFRRELTLKGLNVAASQPKANPADADASTLRIEYIFEGAKAFNILLIHKRLIVLDSQDEKLHPKLILWPEHDLATSANTKDLDTSNRHSRPKPDQNERSLASTQRKEITFAADQVFFELLSNGSHQLQHLGQIEANQLLDELGHLQTDLGGITECSRDREVRDLDLWRDVAGHYLDAALFVPTDDRRGVRTAAEARKRLQHFTMQMADLRVSKRFRRTTSRRAFDRLQTMNMRVLINIYFQELNFTAYNKILKKFDKQTALHARSALTKVFAWEESHSGHLARSLCALLAERLRSAVPPLDDYLCPVCFSIAFKPIRLECRHIFCIRCVLLLQRQQQVHCPMCRSPTIMKADSTNLDHELIRFLQKYFPSQVRAKQRENEQAIAKDQFGEARTCNMS